MSWECSEFGTSDISTERMVILGHGKKKKKIQNLVLTTAIFSCYTYQQTIVVDW
jgi:hypothetical protein